MLDGRRLHGLRFDIKHWILFTCKLHPAINMSEYLASVLKCLIQFTFCKLGVVFRNLCMFYLASIFTSISWWKYGIPDSTYFFFNMGWKKMHSDHKTFLKTAAIREVCLCLKCFTRTLAFFLSCFPFHNMPNRHREKYIIVFNSIEKEFIYTKLSYLYINVQFTQPLFVLLARNPVSFPTDFCSKTTAVK